MIRRIQEISCSLNLGLIYNLDFNYEPSSGVKIKIYFVNETGEYSIPNMLPLQKVFIRIGSSSFTMYPVASGIEKGPNRRVIWVEFEDEFFMLSKYYIVWPGKGCGTNVFPLGTPVGAISTTPRNLFFDASAADVEEVTRLNDYEYSFNDFLSLLKTKFNVNVQAAYDASLKRSDIYGSFLEVLQSWCSYYNLSFFFENGIIKIFNPVNLNITLPSQPPNAVSYSTEVDIRSTYGKTVSNWFMQEGGQLPLNQAESPSSSSDSTASTSPTSTGGTTSTTSSSPSRANLGGPLLLRSATLFPIGYEFNLEQPAIDMNQVVAAQYGEDFWFLYNYWLGTATTNCGFTEVDSSSLPVGKIGGSVAVVNNTLRAAKFKAFSEYGQTIAGRWYLSNRKDDISIDEQYTWFNEAPGQIFNFTSALASNRIIKPDFLRPNTLTMQIIPGTIINQYYPGINYFGQRIAYYDPVPYPSESFQLDDLLKGEIANLMENFNGWEGSQSIDFSSLGAEDSYVVFAPLTFSQSLQAKFQNISSETSIFKPRYDSMPIRGTKTIDYVSAKSAAESPQTTKIIRKNEGPNIVTNTSVLKESTQGSYTVYYDKYERCASRSTADNFYQFKFEPQEISSDNKIGVTFQKTASNTYILRRDFSLINSLVENPYLNSLAQARSFPTRRVTYTLNYFENIPSNFLSNGLVGLNVSITDDGIQATYTYSNEVVRVPDYSSAYTAFAQGIRNSWIRRYQPEQVIS